MTQKMAENFWFQGGRVGVQGWDAPVGGGGGGGTIIQLRTLSIRGNIPSLGCKAGQSSADGRGSPSAASVLESEECKERRLVS